ncbi:MAG: response regulator [Holophagaceae bacterium]|nr:response regulator [Holophagaceae bacterium]
MGSFLSRLRISTKLSLAFGLGAALLACVSLWQVNAVREDGQEIIQLFENRMVPIRQLKLVSDAYVLDIANTARLVRGGALPPEQGLQKVRQARANIKRDWAAYHSSFQVAEQEARVQETERLMAQAEPLLDYLEVLFYSEDLPRLDRFLDQSLVPVRDSIVEQLNQLSRQQEMAGRDQVQASTQRVKRAQAVAISIILAGFLLALILGRLIAKDLGWKINQIVAGMRAAADGDLKHIVMLEGRDEFADMASELNRGIDRLRQAMLALAKDARMLRESEAKAQAANRAKSAFLSNMSHELRTPLNAIIGYAQLMHRNPDRTTKDQDQLRHILHAGEHLLSLINDVLSISKIESGGLALRPAPFSTAQFFHALRALFELRASGKGIGFELDVEPGFPDYLVGDEGKLRQVLVNLIGNAVKFTDSGFVALRAAYHAGLATFEVRDTGPGISEADLKRLFEQFFQAETNQRAAEGTGLGLHISRALVRLMGGDLTAESRLDVGSTFSFQVALPEAEQAMELEGKGEVLGMEPGQKPFVLLVVDDREENRDLLTQLFGSVGFAVHTANEGRQALEVFAQQRPDFVWMDLRMPGMDGFEAIARLRELEASQGLARTPVIAISASVFDLDKASVQQHGFDDFLGKPFRESALFEMLTTYLGVRFLRRAESPTPSASAGPPLEGLARLEPEWRAAFREAVASGDTPEALVLAERVEDAALAQQLRQMIKAYRLEELLSALDLESPDASAP